jgi:hypothetical protein
LAREPALHDRVEMDLQKRRNVAIEDVESGAGAGIDFEQKGLFVAHHEIGRAEPLELEGLGDPLHGRGHRPRKARRQRGRAHRAAIAPQAPLGGRRPLLAEAKHAGITSIGDEQRRHGAPLHALLVIDVAGAHLEPARNDVAAARAAWPLGKPACSSWGRFGGRERVLNPKMIERGEEALRSLDALDRGSVVAQQRPALSDPPQKIGPVFEARAIDEAENGGGGGSRERVERGRQDLPSHASGDVAPEPAAGMRQLSRVGVGEEIGDQRR